MNRCSPRAGRWDDVQEWVDHLNAGSLVMSPLRKLAEPGLSCFLLRSRKDKIGVGGGSMLLSQEREVFVLGGRGGGRQAPRLDACLVRNLCPNKAWKDQQLAEYTAKPYFYMDNGV